MMAVVVRASKHGTSESFKITWGVDDEEYDDIAAAVRARWYGGSTTELVWADEDGDEFDPRSKPDVKMIATLADQVMRTQGLIIKVWVRASHEAWAPFPAPSHMSAAATAVTNSSATGVTTITEGQQNGTSYTSSSSKPQNIVFTIDPPSQAASAGALNRHSSDGGRGSKAAPMSGSSDTETFVETTFPSASSSVSSSHPIKLLELSTVTPLHGEKAVILDDEDEEEDTLPSECLWLVKEGSLIESVLEICTLVVILISVVNFCLETLPQFRILENGEERTSDHPTFFLIETVCIAWFTVEYFIRWISSRNRSAFPWQPMNIIDLIAILPYYIALGVGSGDASSLAVMRILRLSRVSRLFKFSRHSQGLQDMIVCIASSSSELGLFFLIIGVATILFASAEFYAEKDEEDTAFDSIPATFWWAIVTMTTVGYGDISPTSVAGKFVGAITASLGVVLVAIPAGIFISEFMRLHQEKKKISAGNLPPAEAQLMRLELMLNDAMDTLENYRHAKETEEHDEHMSVINSVNSSGMEDPTEMKANKLRPRGSRKVYTKYGMISMND